MPGLKLDARSYAILILAAIGVTLSVALVAQQTPVPDRDTSRYRVEDPAAATRQVAEANREIARSNQMIAESIRELADAVRGVGTAVESLDLSAAAAQQQQPGMLPTPVPPVPDEATTTTPQNGQTEGVFEFDR